MDLGTKWQEEARTGAARRLFRERSDPEGRDGAGQALALHGRQADGRRGRQHRGLSALLRFVAARLCGDAEYLIIGSQHVLLG